MLINEEGRRFTDGSKYISGSTDLLTKFLDNVEDTTYIVLDKSIYERHTGQVAFSPKIGDLVKGARDIGAPVIEADSLDALKNELDAEGVDGDQASATIEEFNRAMHGDADERLRPPREENRFTVDEPPFYAVAVQPTTSIFAAGLTSIKTAKSYHNRVRRPGLITRHRT